jgi:hypothetical protein
VEKLDDVSCDDQLQVATIGAMTRRLFPLMLAGTLALAACGGSGGDPEVASLDGGGGGAEAAAAGDDRDAHRRRWWRG